MDAAEAWEKRREANGGRGEGGEEDRAGDWMGEGRREGEAG